MVGSNMGPPRRRSVDVGGLALALEDETRGHGWGGWEEGEIGETNYAENLIDVRAHTEMAVNLEDISTSMPSLTPQDRGRLISSLASWTFEPHKLPPEEVLTCAYILFEAVFRIEGMREDCGVDLAQMPLFLNALQQTYRRVNNYHNFEHALDVFQAIYCILQWEGLVPELDILLSNQTWRRPPRETQGLIDCLNNSDIFALCIAAVGHDVGHPGLTNNFLKNAKTPLAVVYDDKSVLEQMHYSLLLQIMHQTGLGGILDRSSVPPPRHSFTASKNGVNLSHHSDPPKTVLSGHDPPCTNTFRKLLLLTVLSTDMGVHDTFMKDFEALITCRRSGTHTEDDDFRTRVLICQALIKCTDISNPARPYKVSQHWASALSSEWSTQVLLEKHLHLPTTVYPSSNELSKANGQVFFIERFADPLFDSVKRGVPQTFASQCKENLRIWQELRDRLSNQPSSVTPPADEPPTTEASSSAEYLPSPCLPCPTFPSEFLSAFPPTLPKSLLESDLVDAYTDDQLDDSSVGGFSHHASTSSLGSTLDFVSASGESLLDEFEAEQGSHYESCESESSMPSSPAGRHPTDVILPKLEISTNRPSHIRTKSHSSRHSTHSHSHPHSRHPRIPSAVSPQTNSIPEDNAQSDMPLSPDSQPGQTRPPSLFSAQSNRTSFTNFSNTTSASISATNATVAIRKAYQASVRKTKSTRSFHRSSWNPTPAEFNAIVNRPPQAVVFNISTASVSSKPPTPDAVDESENSLTPHPAVQSKRETISLLTPGLVESVGTTPT
ncbi:unnamed protein product [Somion occarium]|uniref:Phosphodiesterase n=1 Tax=Somion occarium TaxID=3059160 RepID=A0ABP1CYB3_9APHY